MHETVYELMNCRLRVFAIAALVAAALPAFATEYIVSSASQISQAMQTARAGDTLTMTNGSWTNQDILFQGSGVAGNPIVLRARSYGSVTLNGTSRLRIAGNYLVAENFLFLDGNCASNPVVEFRNGSNESNYCRFTNSAIINYSPPDINTDSKWVSMYGTYNRVDHCFFRNKTNSGTTLVVWLSNRANYHRIDHNHFGLRPELGFNGGETIRVGTSDWSMYDSFTTVEYNLFEQCNGETEIISSKSCGNVYRYNTFRSCAGTLTLRHGNRCTVEGNFFFGNGVSGSGGIRIIGEDHKVFNNYVAGTTGDEFRAALSLVNGIPNSPLSGYYQVKRAVVAFNTLVDNVSNVALGAGASSSQSLPPLDCTIANNIVRGTQSPLIDQIAAPINMTLEGNIFYGATLGISPTPSGIRIADPQLAAAGADGVRRLNSGSPAINTSAGTYSFVQDDMDGQLRDSLKDVGADEHASSSAVRRPLSAADVGPNSGTASVQDGDHGRIIRGFKLEDNYPNPFNPTTTIRYEVPTSVGTGHALSLLVFDVLGRRIATLVDESKSGGVYTVEFDGDKLPSGVYFYKLQSGKFAETKKMILTR